MHMAVFALNLKVSSVKLILTSMKYMFAIVYINLIPCLRYTYCMKKINSQFLFGVLNMCYRDKL